MKKIMNFIAIHLCGLLLLTGCTTPSSSLPSELVGQTLKYPDTINMKAKEFFAMADEDNAEKIKQQWLDEMSARYGVTFNISFVTTITTDGDQSFSTYSSEIDSILSGQTEFDGLVQIDSFQSIQKAIDNDTVIPLDDLLTDNAIWNALPDDLKSTFTYDGHIYAIPTHITRSVAYPRVIIKTALEQTGMTVTDLDSLKKFALAYTQKTGNFALSSFGLGNLQDVLNVYGLYYKQEYYAQPFAYDPTEDCFADFLTKGAAIDALEYLRELYAAGALDISFDYGYWVDNDINQYASGGFYDYTQTTQEVNLNSTYPQVLENTVFGFVMTKNTPQPKETMALVIDMLFGSEQNYLDCWLGSSDNYILNSDGTITVKMVQNADGRYVLPSTPGLTGGLTDVFPYSDGSIYYTKNGVIATEFGAGYNNRDNDLMKEMIEKGKAVKVSPAYSLMNSPTYNASQVAVWPDRFGKITDLFQNCMMDAITSTEFTVKQIVDQYRLDMLNMGGNVMLDEMNAAIGKKTAYYYG